MSKISGARRELEVEAESEERETLKLSSSFNSSFIFPIIIMETEISIEAREVIRDQFDHGNDQHFEIVEEMTRGNESVTQRMDQMVSNSTPLHPERCIFRVPHSLRHGNEEFYEPQVISIGPYHRGKPGLASMEEHKIRYLQNIVQRTGNQSVDFLVRAVLPHEENVRKCYAESIGHFSSDELVQMLVLDGCFIIELFYRAEMTLISMLTADDPKIKIIDDDPFINSPVLMNVLQNDILLMENQIPFFILQILFNTIHPHLSNRNQLKRQTTVFFSNRLLMYNSLTSFEFDQFLNKDLFNLDETYLQGCIPQDIEQLFGQNIFHLLDIIHKAICFRFKETCRRQSTDRPSQIIYFVKSATKLKEANVRLNASSLLEERSIFDITFKDGELKVPCLSIDDDSEIQIRNIIVLELCQQNRKMMRFFCDYVNFMDHLIASSDDVDLLTHHHILDNNVIDSNSVDNMFRKLTKNILTSYPNYTYSIISKELNEYCERPWNKWSAILKQKYFNTPWAIISVIAALVLLVLTIAQTVFSIIFR